MAVGPPEAWCWQILRERRWPKGVVCAYCHTGRVERHRQCGRAFHYRCRSCRRIFSDRTATPFGGTKIPLSAWFLAISLIGADSERRPPSMELAEILQVSFKTARRMRRTLLALREDPFIRSIRARMILWMNERERGNGDPSLGERNGDPGSDEPVERNGGLFRLPEKTTTIFPTVSFPLFE